VADRIGGPTLRADYGSGEPSEVAAALEMRFDAGPRQLVERDALAARSDV
jgi:hypothetical protein